MTEPRRSTIYLEPELHQALRLKAAVTDRSMSDLVNEAIRSALAETPIMGPRSSLDFIATRSYHRCERRYDQRSAR
ncbi:MAG: hypothetical protein EG823_02565 [Actinobacteria bacterium]|nr:hypothetical protein [Actinomycetota bacterium]